MTTLTTQDMPLPGDMPGDFPEGRPDSAPRVPFNKPYLSGREFTYLQQVLARRVLAGDGPFTRLCAQRLKHLLGVKFVLMTTSCTHALEMAAILLDIQPGDEVIVPSFTFVSTVNAFVLRGARPVFVDIRPDTLNLDPDLAERAITSKTRAVVPVHYGGIACDMEAFVAMARRYEIDLIEDNAHGLFGRYKDAMLGRFGRFAALSFHETKNITCGEGGALLLNDERDIHRAEIIREKGTNRSAFFRGEADKYTWQDIGSSYLPSDLLSALLYAQLEQAESIQERRCRLWQTYYERLGGWACRNGIILPHVPSDCVQPYHLFYLLMPDSASRDGLLEYLRAASIGAVFHYLPLHVSPMGRRFGGSPGDCPVSEDVSARLIRLPFFTEMSADQQSYVIETLLRYRIASK